MSAGDRLWDQACQDDFIREVGRILAEREQNGVDATLEEIIYEYEDKIGDIDEGDGRYE